MFDTGLKLKTINRSPDPNTRFARYFSNENPNSRSDKFFIFCLLFFKNLVFLKYFYLPTVTNKILLTINKCNK